MVRNSSSVVKEILGRVIAYHTAFTLLPGVSVPGAVFLSQAFYWSKNSKTKARNGWFYKNQRGEDSWESETGLTPKQQANARRSLVAIGVLEEERRDVPAKIWYRVNCERLLELLAEQVDEEPSGNGCNSQFFPLVDSTIPSGQSGDQDGQSLILPKSKSITETTSKITTINNSELQNLQKLRAEAVLRGQQAAAHNAKQCGDTNIGKPAINVMRSMVFKTKDEAW